jgi:Uma2 family endonuclease
MCCNCAIIGRVRQESQRHYNLDEYFAVEETSSVKHEYYDGQIFAMAGASLQHNDIVANLLAALRPALIPRNIRTFGSDLRVQTPGGLYTYPDLSVCRGEPILVKGRPDSLVNPVVVMEVLSEATREYDRGQKFSLYKEIPTLREYVLVEQSEVLVEKFHCAEGQWISETHEQLDAVLRFISIPIQLALREIYSQVFPL